MSASRNPFPKFTLKPSSLSQHTVNFNKILEQVPVPKIDPLELVKPLENTIKNESNSQENHLSIEKENTQTTSEGREFVFGEKLTDRVVNVASESENKNDSEITGSQNSIRNSQADTNEKSDVKSSLWGNANNGNVGLENEADQIDNNDINTLLRLNCKLFLLETDKAKWIERGYGILKIIDSSDGLNCKIMMWADKTFRLILNTKFFEKMQIDKANQKSIRFNATDNGSVRIFLVKTANPNDCDELYSKLRMRFNEYLAQLEMNKQAIESKSEVSSSSQSSTSEHNKSKKEIVFKCECNLAKNELSMPASKLYLYNYSLSNVSTSQAENLSNPNCHQLLLDIVDASHESTIYLSTYLKLIKTKKQKINEFEVNESFLLSSPSTSKSASFSSMHNFKITINDPEAASKFLSFYEKEPQLHAIPDESSNDASELNSDNSNENSNQENEEDSDADEPRRKNDTTYESKKQSNLNSSRSDSEDEDAEETANSSESNKKRKNESSSQEYSSKTFKKTEKEEEESNKPKREQSDDDCSKEAVDDQMSKKTKLSNKTDDE